MLRRVLETERAKDMTARIEDMRMGEAVGY